MCNEKICDKIGMDYPEQLVKKSTLVFIQKVVKQRKPDDIMNLMKDRKVGSQDTRIHFKYILRTIQFQRIYLNSAIKLQNTIDFNITSIEIQDNLEEVNISIEPGYSATRIYGRIQTN